MSGKDPWPFTYMKSSIVLAKDREKRVLFRKYSQKKIKNGAILNKAICLICG
jgi:hypothetical protein